MMGRYTAQRLVAFVPVLALLSIITFIILRVVPGDPAITLATAGSGGIATENIEAIRKGLGLDESYPQQYMKWIVDVATLDFGRSLSTGRPVDELILESLPRTVEIALGAVVLSSLIGIPMGVVSAARHGSWVDQALRVFGVLGLALPSFWLATLILLGLVVYFDWLPPLGWSAPWENPWVNFQQVVWPVLALSVPGVAAISRMTRSSVLDVLGNDYIRTARAKGLSPSTVFSRHALRPAVLPIFGLIGVQLAAFIGGSVVIETLFNIPGTGLLMITSIQNQDFPVVQTLVPLYGLLVLFINLGIDLTASALDPRIARG